MNNDDDSREDKKMEILVFLMLMSRKIIHSPGEALKKMVNEIRE